MQLCTYVNPLFDASNSFFFFLYIYNLEFVFFFFLFFLFMTSEPGFNLYFKQPK